MYEEQASAEMQEVAEPATQTAQEGVNEAETAEQPQAQPNTQANEQTEQTENTAKQTKRDFEKDAAYAKLRREAEEAKRDASNMREALLSLNIQGETSGDLYDNAVAYKSGRPVEAVKAERLERERMRTLEEQNKILLQREYERIYNDDLEAIKKAYPDEKIKNVQELGEEFMRLRANGVDRIVAYEAVKAAETKTKKPMPVSTGSVKSTGSAEKDYYSSDEVDRMSSKEMDDPKVMEKIFASMRRWNKKG